VGLGMGLGLGHGSQGRAALLLGATIR